MILTFFFLAWLFTGLIVGIVLGPVLRELAKAQLVPVGNKLELLSSSM